MGVKGLVTDEYGEPITDAVIRIEGKNKNIKVSKGGEYWRLLLPGVYKIRVEKLTRDEDDQTSGSPGILSHYQTIKVRSGKVTRKDFKINDYFRHF